MKIESRASRSKRLQLIKESADKENVEPTLKVVKISKKRKMSSGKDSTTKEKKCKLNQSDEKVIKLFNNGKVAKKKDKKHAEHAANTTIDAGAIKGSRKSKSWVPEENGSEKLETNSKCNSSSPQPRKARDLRPLQRSPANYQLERIKYQKRLDQGKLKPYEIEQESYIKNLWDNSQGLYEPLQKTHHVSQNQKLKLLNISKSTENDDNLDESKTQIVKSKILNAQKQGLLGFSFSEQHLEALDSSKSFEHPSGQSIDLVARIDFHQKREKLRALANDSRLDDSRKYLLNSQTPEFKDVPNENSAEEESKECEIIQFENRGLDFTVHEINK